MHDVISMYTTMYASEVPLLLLSHFPFAVMYVAVELIVSILALDEVFSQT